MFKSLVVLCVVLCVVVEARPKWQFLPPKPGYIPVYIRPGDTPLEDINPELAEAFHALPAGRSSGKEVEAEQDPPEVPENTDSFVDRRPYEKKILEKKQKKATASELEKPVERR
uniref:Putative gustatory receptor 9 n=1 Tax=Conopomorpha sinensis TaxID=940481 RepID=A0A3S7SGM1_9NEOP|nr:putative gustatory receptor 9 [Conopomorpha sinensis]